MNKYKIMIVDDEVGIRDGIVGHINWDELGFEICAVAENGVDALEKAENLEIDVVLTDVKMPFMDGLEMCSELVKSIPDVKLIILSGFDEFEYAKRAIKLNVIEYILKPVNVKELTDILARVRQALDSEIIQKQDIDALRESYKKSLPMMRDSFFNELLWGALPQDSETRLQEHGFDLKNAPNLAVAVFDVSGKASPISRELIPFSVKQLVEEQLAGRCENAVFISSRSIIAITGWQEDPIAGLMQLSSEICLRCEKVLELDVHAGIGRSQSSVKLLHKSFEEAKEALEYRVISGLGKAIYIQDMEQARLETAHSESWNSHQLYSALKFGTKEQVGAYIDAELSKIKSLDSWQRQSVLLSIYSAIYRIIIRNELNSEKEFSELIERFSLPFGNEATLIDALSSICLAICERISQKRKTAAKSLIETAKQYIEDNYSDSSLSVEKICDFLHVSSSYFSSIFKQNVGQSFVSYLTQVRLNHAVILLRETDDKTYIVAEKVGYSESNYFSYVFKKRFGVSPTAYRS